MNINSIESILNLYKMIKVVVLAVLFAVVLSAPIPYKLSYDNNKTPEITRKDFGTPAINHELISKVNSKSGNSWTAGENKFLEDKSLAQVKKLLGWKPNPASKDKFEKSKVYPQMVGALPTNYDASTQYPNCPTIGTIYNQAECGSCWAFGCVESASDRMCIQTGAKDTMVLSFMDLVCCGPDDGCEGGDPYDAYQYAVSPGLVTATCDPYTIPTCPPAQQPCLNFQPTPACVQQCNDTENWDDSIHAFANSYGVDSNATAIQVEIITNGPVEACFSVYEDFVTYKSGVYQYENGDYLGGHCIKILGWGVDTESGLPYWLCNNSWTTYWGDDGQFMILRGEDECGIEDSVVAGMYTQ